MISNKIIYFTLHENSHNPVANKTFSLVKKFSLVTLWLVYMDDINEGHICMHLNVQRSMQRSPGQH